MAFKFEGKEMYPIFVFAKCCWLLHSKVVRLGNNAHSKQRKATPKQTLQFHVKFMYMPCWFTIYIVCFFNIWFWFGSNIRNSLDAEKAEKSIKTYRFYRVEEDNQ